MSSSKFENLVKWESVRRKSFKNPAGVDVLPEADSLAKNGFFYYNVKKEIQCFCCGIQIPVHLEENYPEYIFTQHLSERCPFIYKLPVGNISLENEQQLHQHQQQTASPYLDSSFKFRPLQGTWKGFRTVEVRPRAVPERHG